jgi:hypothetical protein
MPSEQHFFDISNLDINNFNYLVESIGIPAIKFAHYRRYIGALVDLRHKCAHGERIKFDSSKKSSDIAASAFDIQSEILCLMHLLAVEVIDLFEKVTFLAKVGSS